MGAVARQIDTPQALPALILEDGCISCAYSRLLKVLAAVILWPTVVVIRVRFHLGAGVSLGRASGNPSGADARSRARAQRFTQLLTPPPALSVAGLTEQQGALHAVMVSAAIAMQTEAAVAELQTLPAGPTLLRRGPTALHEDAIKALWRRTARSSM